MSNFLIVESENDKFFVEAFIKHISLNIKVGEPVCSIDEYDCIGGMGKLEKRLEALTHRIIKGEVSRVGIIFDADKVGIEQRTSDIQNKIDFMKSTLPDEFKEINFTIYIQNKGGYGELETVLKEIKSKDSQIADCLNSWQECLPAKKQLNQKDFDKFWIQIYQRYDCCTKKEQTRAGDKCSNEVSFSKNIYDLDNDILKDLIKFLKKLGKDNI